MKQIKYSPLTYSPAEDCPTDDIEILNEKGTRVAKLWIDDALPSHDTWNHDQHVRARVMAAGPELLFALTEMVESGMNSETIAQAEAAISKAITA